MPLSFDTKVSYHVYQRENENDTNNYLRDSMDRLHAELTSLQGLNPKTYLEKAFKLFQIIKRRETTVLFGNLGRHPLLLNYLLDLGFTSQESVGVFSPWKMDCPYVVESLVNPLDVLFIVEPFFGYTIHKPDNVCHLVILTSHLVLNIPKNSCLVTYLFVGREPGPVCISKNHVTHAVFEPPQYHDGQMNRIPEEGDIHLNVTSSKSAHEAYLRLLTGREMLRDRLHTVGISPNDEEIIKFYAKITQKRLEKLGWNNQWINRLYSHHFENTGTVLLIHKPHGHGLS